MLTNIRYNYIINVWHKKIIISSDFIFNKKSGWIMWTVFLAVFSTSSSFELCELLYGVIVVFDEFISISYCVLEVLTS
jgi:hypothetical protein